MGASLKSLRRFATFILRVNAPSAYFHQTLTCSPPEPDYRKAKTKLEKLLDNIHHRFSHAASFYVVELQENGGYHFHVLFLFFGSVPSNLEKRLRGAIWTAWKGMQDESLARIANPLRRRDEKFKDREKTIRYFAGDCIAAPPRWWGCRNKALILSNSSPVDRKAVRAAMAALKPSKAFATPPRPEPAKTHPRHTMQFVNSLKETVEFHQNDTWEAFKKRKMGLTRKVTNAEFLDFLNGVERKSIEFP